MPRTPKVLLEAARFRVLEYTQNFPGGQSPVKRQVVDHPGSVVILPLLEGNRICLIRNYRIAVDKELIELPAGTLDRPETPLLTAKRELREETGFLAASWQELPGFYMSPGILNEQMHFYVAQGLTPGAAEREPGEQIENLILPWSEAVEMVLAGRIVDAKSVAGILKWELSHQPR